MAVRAMTPADVVDRVLNKKPLFIVDVRNADEYADWRIEGESVESINLPYYELLDGVEPYLDRIPKDKELLVVCAKEGASVMVAEELAKAGYEPAYLQGGMKAWSTHLYEKLAYRDESIRVYQLVRVGKGCLSYMVISGQEAMVVDPLRFVDAYLRLAEREGVRITHIVDSHLHADHVSGGPELARRTGATYYLMKSEGAVYDFEPLENHERIRFADADVQVLAVKTPGHTPGSVSFFVNGKLLFSGDTIFVSGLGRPDLGEKVEEWAEDLYRTISEKVASFADDVLVLPAHYADLEKEMNADGVIGEYLGTIRKENR
ncbi:MAG: hypothetical protein A6D91_11085, partial [Bacillaceae bacterium G1]